MQMFEQLNKLQTVKRNRRVVATASPSTSGDRCQVRIGWCMLDPDRSIPTTVILPELEVGAIETLEDCWFFLIAPVQEQRTIVCIPAKSTCAKFLPVSEMQLFYAVSMKNCHFREKMFVLPPTRMHTYRKTLQDLRVIPCMADSSFDRRPFPGKT